MTGQIPAPGRPLVVEISLKTAEGDSLVLEWWRLAVVAGGDPQVPLPVRISYPWHFVWITYEFHFSF